MVEHESMAWLCRSLKDGCGLRLVLCGDEHQLPSVGPGQVLADLIRTDAVPVSRLTVIQGQAAESRIVRNAHALLARRPLELDDRYSDFRFVELPTEVTPGALATAQTRLLAALRRVMREERQSILRRTGILSPLDPVRDIQVLVPRRSGALGATTLNALLQVALNPRGEVRPRIHQRHLQTGDRVICTGNDDRVGPYGLRQGDQGVVVGVDRLADRLSLRLDDDREVQLCGIEPFLLEHAFCTTVHRSQGSEYPIVLLCYHASHRPMLDVRLLYTATRRAKRRLILLADRPTLTTAANGLDDARPRWTGLARHLRDALAAPGPEEQDAA